jgi:predicted MFS family arabinose efflux permease
VSIPDDVMTPAERRAGVGLSAIYALRMLGLFLILPVFSLHAETLPDGANVALIGFALGAFGLTQAFLQVPFGMLSDRVGRKPVIVFGLLVFAVGCVMAALADSVFTLAVARVVQGAGAISAAVTALAADLTREQHRTKIMAMIGSSIALTFAISLVAAPAMYGAIGMSGIFWLTGGLSLAAIVLVLRGIPPEVKQERPPIPTRFIEVLRQPQLLRLNFSVLALHLMQTALWVVVPTILVQKIGLNAASHWQVYLPAALLSFAVMVPAIIVAEKRGKMRAVLLSAIVLILLVQAGFSTEPASAWVVGLWLTVFFIGFNILEATLPSLISRIAPPDVKGAAMGLYNTVQSIGLFAGGALGGLIAKFGGALAVHVACAVLSVLWLALMLSMPFPPPRKTPVAAVS